MDFLIESLKKYFWIINLFLITILIFLTADILNGFVERWLTVEASIPKKEEVKLDKKRQKNRDKDYYEVIAERNIFNSLATGFEGVDLGNIPQDLPETPLQVVLLGTVVGPEEFSFAVIQDKTSKDTSIYRVNDIVLNEAKIIQIERSRVVVLRNGKQESLILFEQESIPSETTSVASIPKGSMIKEVSENRYEIAKDEFENATSNIGTLMTQARVVPDLVDGKINGYKVFAIKPGSLYEKIGMKNGDIIKSINGLDVSSPEKALELFQQLKNESEFTVELLRNNSPQTMTYRVR